MYVAGAQVLDGVSGMLGGVGRPSRLVADRAGVCPSADGIRGQRSWRPGLVGGQPRPSADPRATYFRALYDALEATGPGDLVLFTDWQGDADERLTGEPGSEVVEVLSRADQRGVAVHGLVWRSHLDQTGFFATENRHLGEQLQKRGAEVLLDMRVRAGGSHHQKFVVIRHRDDPTRDVAFVGGIDLAHNRRDDADAPGRSAAPAAHQGVRRAPAVA